MSVGIRWVTLSGNVRGGAEAGNTGSAEMNSSSSAGTLFRFWLRLPLPNRLPLPDEVLSVVVEVLCLFLLAADESGRLLVDDVLARFLLVPPTSSGAGLRFLPTVFCLVDDDDDAELVRVRDRVAGVVA